MRKPLGELLLDLFVSQVGQELARASIGGRDVTLVAHIESPLGCVGTITERLLVFQPVVELRVGGRPVSEQAVSLDVLELDAFDQAPRLDWLEDAEAQLRRWRARLCKRVEQIPETKLQHTMPFDISFVPGPLSLARYTLDHGPPPPRPLAGHLGARAEETARQLRPLVASTGEICALGVDRYTIRITHTPEDADEPSGWIYLQDGDERGAVLYSNDCEPGDSFSVDGNEPLYRLFATWLIRALEVNDLPAPRFADPRFGYPAIELRRWLRFGDQDGPPLDHRIEPGAIRHHTYAELNIHFPDGTREAMPRARDLYHRFVRDVIDPCARTEG